MYLTLNFINQNLNHLLCMLFVSFLLTPKYSRPKTLFIFSFLSFFIFLYKFNNFTDATTLIISSIASHSALYIYAIIAFKDSLFKKFLSCIINFSFMFLSEFIVLGIHNSFFNKAYSPLPTTKEFFICNILGMSIQIIMQSLFLIVWKFFSCKKDSLNLLYFTLLPTIQFFLLIAIFVPITFGSNVLNPILFPVCILIALISNIILFYYILRRHEKKTIQDAYEELEELYALDLEYYKELESKHEELAKLRHDYQNHLATLYMLISSNKIDTAKEFADSLKLTLQETDNIS